MIDRRLYKTKLCMLYQRGRCNRPSCNFAHGEAELRRLAGSFHGRRDYRGSDLRDRMDRRYSPPPTTIHRKYSPVRDGRASNFVHNQRPISRDRGSSLSRSPIRKRTKNQRSDGESYSSESLRSDGGEDMRRGVNNYSSHDEDRDYIDDQVRQIQEDIGVLNDDKSHFENLLVEEIEKERKLSNRIEDLEFELDKQQDECQRITSRLKKFVKAHCRYGKAQEELKRSRVRLERLGDLLGQEILKHGINGEDSSVNLDNDGDPLLNGDLQKSPSKKRPFDYAMTASEEKNAGNPRKKEKNEDLIPQYEAERVATKSEKHNAKSDERIKQGKSTSTSFISADKVKGSERRRNTVMPSTSMAANATDDLLEATETNLTTITNTKSNNNNNNNNNAIISNNSKGDKSSSNPVTGNKQYEGNDDDDELDLEKSENDIDNIDDIDI